MSLSSAPGVGVAPGHSNDFSEIVDEHTAPERNVTPLGADHGIPAALDTITSNNIIDKMFARFDEIFERVSIATKKMFSCVVVLTICNIALATFSILLLVL